MQSTRSKLINLLEKNKEKYISGEQLSKQLNITRSAIWKHMKELEKDGYLIEGKPRKGYRILELPNRLSENALQWGLNTEWLGKEIIHKSTVTSTQQMAHALALDNGKHGTVVIADQQTKGKGRLDREWHSAKEKGVWLSMILRPNLLPYLAPQLTLVTATILADVLSKYADVQPQIKWPNDILINNKKVAGILTEMQAEQDQINYVIIGIGLNVNQEINELPKEIQNKATSLFIETNNLLNIKDLVQNILVTFEKEYMNYINNGFSNIKQKWEHYGFKINKKIWIKTAKGRRQGVFIGIAEDGALLIKFAAGEIEKIYSGEIEWHKEGDEV